MSSTGAEELRPGLTSRRRIRAVGDRFEAAWKQGAPPEIGHYLAAPDVAADRRRRLLIDLVGIDLEYRWRRAHARLTSSAATAEFMPEASTESLPFPARPLIEDYLRRFPPLPPIDDDLLEAVADEYHVRHVWGDRPGREEYARRFADHWEKLAALLADVDANRPEVRSAVAFEVVRGENRGRRLVFDRHGTLLIGRAQSAHLRFPRDRRVSSYHARLEANPPECYVADLGSRNGTFVNGARVRDKLLSDGDVVTVGENDIVVRTAPAASRTGALVPATRHVPQALHARPTPSFRDATLPAGYEVVREIGRGGMGAVYEAIQTKSGERVAIKVVVAGEEASKRSAQLFLREASVLSQLRHKRIVSFCECAMIGGRFFLVMEYVETIGVKQHLSDRPEDARIRYYCGIICQVLEALVYAHGRGLVHRDIKPSNILVSLAGGRLRAKLADFGLAKNFETAGFSSLTRDGELRGTLPFMPPEQVIDSRYAKPPADIYSAGATLYYYLAGRYPHDFAKSSSKFAVVLRRSPTPLLRVNPNLPEGLASIVEKALAHDPASRFPSAKEMHRALYPFAKRPE